MFFIQSDITVESMATLSELAAVVSGALQILPLQRDYSGRYDDVVVFVSECFGLEFSLGRTDEDPPGTFQLAISSNVDAFDFDGSEREVDATDYVLSLLRKAGVEAGPRDRKLLF